MCIHGVCWEKLSFLYYINYSLVTAEEVTSSFIMKGHHFVDINNRHFRIRYFLHEDMVFEMLCSDLIKSERCY